MACTYCHSPVLLPSNNASMITRSSLSSTFRARESKLDVPIAGSQLLGRDSTLLKLGPRRYSATKFSISRRVNLTTRSAVRGGGEMAVPDESESQLMDVVAKRVQPYLKLARLRWNGAWPLTLWPFCWGAAFATENGPVPDWRIFALFAIASVILHSAICTVNDLWDKDFDGKTPAVWGVAHNWSMFLGWSAVRGSVALSPPAPVPALVFGAAWCWTFLYDVIYAHQDIKDDREAGVKSLPLVLGESSKLRLAGLGAALVASLGIAGQIAAFGWPFYVGVVAMAFHLSWQVATMDLKKPSDCWAKFLSNIWVGAFVIGGIAGAKLLA